MTNIRQITCYDIERIQSLASDPALAATSNLPSPYPPNGAADWFDSISRGIADGRQVVFAVTERESLIGVMSLNAINMAERCCRLDYWIGKPYWGLGHASKAATLAISYATNILGLSNITSGCLKTNLGSKRVLEKSGFTFNSEALYSGPFKNRFGSMKVLHCFLQLKQQSAQQGGEPDAA